MLSCLTLHSFHNKTTSVTTYYLWKMAHMSKTGIRLQNFISKKLFFCFLFLHKWFPIFCFPILLFPIYYKKSCGFCILKCLWWLSHTKNCQSREVLHDVGDIVFLNLFSLCSFFFTWLFMIALHVAHEKFLYF